MSACATCDGFFFRGREVAVVGGGDTALEEATFLTRFADKVTMLVRRGEFRGSKIMQDRALNHPKIDVLWNKEVTEVRGEMTVGSLQLRDTATGEESELAVQGMFVAIGYKPNTDLFDGQLDIGPGGYLDVKGESRLERGGRLHRRRRPRPSLPAGRDRRRRRLQGRDRCRALARVGRRDRGVNRHELVAAKTADPMVPSRHRDFGPTDPPPA